MTGESPAVEPEAGESRSQSPTSRKDPNSQCNGSPSRRPMKHGPRFDAFLQRQSVDSKTQLRRKICKLHRDLIVEANEDYDSCNWGTHGLEGFRKKLLVHSGSVAAAWRTVLDPENHGCISVGGLCEKTREIGFSGHLKKLWAEMDKDQDGFISLRDIDARAADALETFRDRVIQMHGSTLMWWNHVVPRAGTVRLSHTEFTEACKDLGYATPAEIDYTFKCLQIGIGHKYLTLAEIDPQAAQAKDRADPCAEGIAAGLGRSAPVLVPQNGQSTLSKMLQEQRKLSKSAEDNEVLRPTTPIDPTPAPPSRPRPLSLSSSLPSFKSAQSPKTPPGNMSPTASRHEHSGAATPTRTARWGREISTVQRSNIAEEKNDFMSKFKGLKDSASLRNSLLHRYHGRLYDAWREGFRFPDEKGRLNFVQFCEEFRAIGYVGNLKNLFEELDTEKTSFISFKDLDPVTYKQITSYKEMLRAKYGNLAKAWVEAMGEGHAQGKMKKELFLEHVKELGWEGDATALFGNLQRAPRTEYLYLRDFDAPAYLSLCRSDLEMMCEEKPTEKNHSFSDRNENCFRQKWSRHQSALMTREIVNAQKAERELNLAAGDAASLKVKLAKKYGTLALAWKNRLDMDNHGRLSWQQFCEAMRRVGFLGDIRHTFDELDRDKLGYLTLGSFDPEVDAALKKFRQQLSDRYGDVITAWRTKLDVRKAGRLDEKEFAKRMRELGLDGDPQLLFDNLQAWHGRKFITLADIDQRHMEAYYRDDMEASTVKMPHGWAGDTWTPIGRAKSQQLEAMKRPESMPVLRSIGNSPHGSSFDNSLNGTRKGSDGGSDLEVTSPTSTRGGEGRKLNNPTTSVSGQPSEVFRSTSVSTWSRELGKRFRTKVEVAEKGEKEKQMGCKTIAEFKKMLVRSYGSIVTGWRMGIDTDGIGRFSKFDFVRVVRELGFSGDVSDLWNELVPTDDGYVTLEVLDKGSWEAVSVLRDLFVKHCGCIRSAFDFLAEGEAWVEEEKFGQKLAALGFEPGPQYIHKLFLCLMEERGKRYLYRKDLEALLIGVPTFERSKVWLGHKGHEPVKKLPRTDNLKKATDNLKSTLTRKFGCLYAGWWKGIDIDGTDRVPISQFQRQVNAIGFGSNFKALLKALGKSDGEEETISFKDLDAEQAEAVEAFSTLVISKYGRFEVAWKEGTKVHWDGEPVKKFYLPTFEQSGMLDEKTFKKLCTDLGYEGDSGKLFLTFLPQTFDAYGVRNGRNVLFFEDFGPLSLRNAASSPSARRQLLQEVGSPSARDREPRYLYASGTSPCDNNAHVSTSPKARSMTMSSARDTSPVSPKDMGARDLTSLKRAMCHKHGSITASWRRGLDTKNLGHVSYLEFCDGLRNLCFQGDIKQAWKVLVTEGCDHLTFEMFAPEEDKLLKEFFLAIDAECGSLPLGWVALDRNRNGWVEEDEVEALCKLLGIAGDAKKLFKLLKVEPGTRHVTYTDLEVTAKLAGVKRFQSK